MNLSRNARRAGLILGIWLIAIIVSLVVVPRLPGELPTWLIWAVAILATVMQVADVLFGLFEEEEPTPTGAPFVHVQPSPEPLTPLDLPPDLPTWTGREKDTQWLLDQLQQETDVVAITGIVGMGGIGKSALAVHAAHQVEPDDFPDGILWLDLRGAQLDVLLAGVAGYYGQRRRVDDEPTLERKAAVVRSILAGKRALLILDNAETSEQLDLLLPGEGPCVTVVTTRERNLRALHGAATRPLEELTPAEAEILFVKILGRPLSEEERDQVTALHELLEGLPLALDLAASRLREWRRPWADYVAAVGDELRGLDMLADPEDSRSVRAAFALSYDALDADQEVLFRALGALRAAPLSPPKRRLPWPPSSWGRRTTSWNGWRACPWWSRRRNTVAATGCTPCWPRMRASSCGETKPGLPSLPSDTPATS
ncbi:MAG: NB-ARC domain-containing protein [Anaerolineae bacterium]